MAHGGDGFKKLPWYKKIFLLWTHDGSVAVYKWFDGWSFDTLAVMPLGFLALLLVAGFVDPDAVTGTLAMVVALSPVWLPIFLAVFFWVTWMHYIRYMFWFKEGYILLEVQLPPEVEKTPAAMELFLTSMFQTGGEATFLKRIWDGSHRPIWSLEIASNEGQIKFYIHLRRSYKNVIEARLYGQFPEARVTEVEDYTAKVPFNLEEYDIFGVEYQKSAPQLLPIKTYVDYELNKNPDKPENQVDPLTQVLEFMGQIGSGEYIWSQIIIKAHKKDEWYGFYSTADSHYKQEALEAIQKITKKAITRAQNLIEGKDAAADAERKKVGSRGAMLLTSGEKEQVEAIERQLTKLVFECGIRTVYVSRKDKTVGINNGGLITFFGAFKKGEYNGFGPADRLTAYFDYPWQDFRDIRLNKEKRNAFFRYKHRAYHYVPYDQVPIYMTTEELATLWHFPSSVVKTPALDRVPSRRAEAPINLPT